MFSPQKSATSASAKTLDTVPRDLPEGILDSTTYCRHDGRFPEQLRPLSITPGPLSKAVGSAFVSIGREVVVVVSVTPPRPCLRSRVFKALGTVECRVRTVCPVEPGKAEMADCISNSLNVFVNRAAFPNSFVTVDVLVLEGSLVDDREAVLASAINGAGVALAHAGLELLAVPVCISFALLSSSALILDPCSVERRYLRHQNAPVGVAVMFLWDNLQRHEMAYVDVQGAFADLSLLTESLKQLVEGAITVSESVIRPALMQIQ